MRKPRSLFVLLLALSLFSLPGNAQAGLDQAKTRTIVEGLAARAAAEPGIAGMSIAVLQKGGETSVTVALGSACLGGGAQTAAPMTDKTRFKIGSVTKIFTAALVHRLMEQGRLSQDTTIDRFFPGFPGGAGITVRNLLEHTSGLVEMLALPAVQADLAKAWSPDEIIAMVAQKPPLFAPGTRQAYCNTGFLMLAVICERLTGRSYADLVQEMFVEGLGMKSLLVGNDDTRTPPGLACGYANKPEGGLGRPMAASLAMAKGTGNLLATPADFVRLVNLDKVLARDFLASTPLEPLSLADGQMALVASKRGPYSVGELNGCTLFLFRSPAIALVGKPGNFPGFGSIYFYDRQTSTAVAISVNNENAVGRAIDLAAEILTTLRGPDAPRP